MARLKRYVSRSRFGSLMALPFVTLMLALLVKHSMTVKRLILFC